MITEENYTQIPHKSTREELLFLNHFALSITSSGVVMEMITELSTQESGEDELSGGKIE